MACRLKIWTFLPIFSYGETSIFKLFDVDFVQILWYNILRQNM